MRPNLEQLEDRIHCDAALAQAWAMNVGIPVVNATAVAEATFITALVAAAVNQANAVAAAQPSAAAGVYSRLTSFVAQEQQSLAAQASWSVSTVLYYYQQFLALPPQPNEAATLAGLTPQPGM